MSTLAIDERTGFVAAYGTFACAAAGEGEQYAPLPPFEIAARAPRAFNPAKFVVGTSPVARGLWCAAVDRDAAVIPVLSVRDASTGDAWPQIIKGTTLDSEVVACAVATHPLRDAVRQRVCVLYNTAMGRASFVLVVDVARDTGVARSAADARVINARHTFGPGDYAAGARFYAFEHGAGWTINVWDADAGGKISSALAYTRSPSVVGTYLVGGRQARLAGQDVLATCRTGTGYVAARSGALFVCSTADAHDDKLLGGYGDDRPAGCCAIENLSAGVYCVCIGTAPDAGARRVCNLDVLIVDCTTDNEEAEAEPVTFAANNTLFLASYVDSVQFMPVPYGALPRLVVKRDVSGRQPRESPGHPVENASVLRVYVLNPSKQYAQLKKPVSQKPPPEWDPRARACVAATGDWWPDLCDAAGVRRGRPDALTIAAFERGGGYDLYDISPWSSRDRVFGAAMAGLLMNARTRCVAVQQSLGLRAPPADYGFIATAPSMWLRTAFDTTSPLFLEIEEAALRHTDYADLEDPPMSNYEYNAYVYYCGLAQAFGVASSFDPAEFAGEMLSVLPADGGPTIADRVDACDGSRAAIAAVLDAVCLGFDTIVTVQEHAANAAGGAPVDHARPNGALMRGAPGAFESLPANQDIPIFVGAETRRAGKYTCNYNEPGVFTTAGTGAARRKQYLNLGRHFAMEKFDGVRARWDPQERCFLIGKRPPYTKRRPPPAWEGPMNQMNCYLDGELWPGRGRFNRHASALRTLDWAGLRYVVFDSQDSRVVGLPYDQRMAAVKERVGGHAGGVLLLPPVYQLPADEMEAKTAALDMIRRTCAINGEGLVLRSPWSGYHDSGIIKMKVQHEVVAKTTGIIKRRFATVDTCVTQVIPAGMASAISVGGVPEEIAELKNVSIVIAYTSVGSNGGVMHARYERTLKEERENDALLEDEGFA